MLEQPGFSREIDPKAVAAYLAFNSIPAPLTIFAEARKLPPGHLLRWEGARSAVRRYARPGPVPAERDPPAARPTSSPPSCARCSTTASAPTSSPTSRSASCSPAASTPAGLAALAAAPVGEPLRTFSIGFEEAGFDELARARLVAERYGTDHHELVLRPDAVELLPKLVEAFDEPFGDSSALPTYLVSELAAGEVKVAALRRGRRRAVRRLLHLRRRPPRPPRRPPRGAGARRWPRRCRARDRPRRLRLQSQALRPRRRACRRWSATTRWKEIFSPQVRAELVGGGAAGWDPLDLYRERYAETAGAEPLARMQDVDLGIYLVDDLLVKTDRSSMAHSLELRVPFLDQRVAEFALGAADAR